MPKKKTVLSFLLIVAMVFSIALTALADGHISTGEITITPNTDPYEYGTAPDRLYVFLYHGYNPYFTGEFDTSECELDRLYVHNQTTNEIVEISTQAVTAYTTTKDALYYITESQTIYKTDYTGRNHTALYQCTEGEIDAFSSYLELLTFIENGNKVVFVDSNTGNAQVVFAYDDLDWIFMLSRTELLVATLAGEYFVYDLSLKQVTDTVSEIDTTNLINTAVLSAAGLFDPDVSVMSTISAPPATVENDISFPLAEYDANIYAPPFAQNFGHQRPISWFHVNNVEGCGSGICKSYRGSSECEGFAWYAHDAFLHIEGTSGWKNAQHVENLDIDIVYGSVQSVRQFFSTLNTGDYIRYGKDGDTTEPDGAHSIVFHSMDDNGIWVYECNQAYVDSDPNCVTYGCGVFFHYYTLQKISTQYSFVSHHVKHDYSGGNTLINLSTHKVSCAGAEIIFPSEATEDLFYDQLENSNDPITLEEHRRFQETCSGYLVDSHSGSRAYASYSDLMHKVSFPCCDGYVLQPHIIISGTVDYCSACGWTEGAVIMSKDIPIVKE